MSADEILGRGTFFLLCTFGPILVMVRERLWTVPFDAQESPPRASYAFLTQVFRDEAHRLGFTPIGTAGDARGHFYDFGYDFFLSKDTRTMVCLTGGQFRLLGRFSFLPPLIGVEAFSVPAGEDERAIVSINNPAACDDSEILQTKLKDAGSLETLMHFHEKRLQVDPPIPLTPETAFREYMRLRNIKAERLVSSGRAVWCDEGRRAYRYTFVGASRKYARQAVDMVTAPFRR